jgi:peptidoglycan hydrolase CwlO-like protein
MRRRKPSTRRPATLAAVLLLAFAVVGAGTHLAIAQDPGALRNHIDRQKGRERQLASAAARLGRLERATSHAVDVMAARLAEAQGDLARWQARLAETQRELRVTRERLVRLRARLAESRRALATMLRQRYTADTPDVVSVVLDAKGFADVLERIEFLRRVQRSDTLIVDAVRRGRDDARHDERVLAALEPRQREQTAAVRSQRDALGRMTAALQSRRAALAQARAARLAALSNTVASRRRAEGELSRLLAAQARAAASHGPGGPWAIPWPIVECESGGQNLPPNGASASGYYQMLDSTWHGLGGSTPHAYQASKAEQDRLAASLWAGGAGAGNWVCAALVGAA